MSLPSTVTTILASSAAGAAINNLFLWWQRRGDVRQTLTAAEVTAGETRESRLDGATWELIHQIRTEHGDALKRLAELEPVAVNLALCEERKRLLEQELGKYQSNLPRKEPDSP